MSSLGMGQSREHDLQLIARKLGHRNIQCSLATFLFILRYWTQSQGSDSCSFNSDTGSRNRNYWLHLPNPGHLDIWNHLRSLHPESRKLISVCASQISANWNMPFPHILLTWGSWVVWSDKAISRSKLVLGMTAEDKRDLSSKKYPQAPLSCSFPQSPPGHWSLSFENVDASPSFDEGGP